MQKLVQVSVVGFVGRRILVKTWFLGQKLSMKIKQDLEVWAKFWFDIPEINFRYFSTLVLLS